MPPSRTPSRVVIAGGGVAALECLMALRDLAGPGLRIQLVSAEDAFTYLPLQVVEPFALGTSHRHPLSRVAEDFGAELVVDAVIEVLGEQRQAICSSGAVLGFDALVLAPGARRVPAYEHAITFGADPRHGALQEVLIDLADGRIEDVAFVVPPDIAWSLPLYELALMTARDLSGRAIHDAHLSVVTPEERPLAIFGPRVSGAVSGLLNAAGIRFIGGSYADVQPGVIRLEPNVFAAGDEDRLLRSSIGGGEGEGTSAGAPLWWPPSKIAGLYLAPYLYRRAGWREPEPRQGFQEVDVPLEHLV
jgi:sulfide:quinone oxidoreductase